MDELENLLSCSICMDIFESPRQLPCQHTYCTPCLSDHITETKKVNNMNSQTFACPLCRTEVKIDDPPNDATLFPINLAYQSILDSKELMKTLEECRIFHETQSNQSCMGKMKKYFCTRSKETQTEPLLSKNGKKTGKSGSLEKVDKLSANDNFNKFFSFSTIYIYNIYQPVLRKMIEPLISDQCSSLQKGITIAYSVLIGLFCISLFLVVLFETEISCFIITFALLVLIIQLLFVRLKRFICNVHVYTVFFVTYIFTFFIIGVIFLFVSYTVCHFVVIHSYAFKRENVTVWTPNGYQIQERHIYSGSGNMDNLFVQSKRDAVFDDYILFLNFHLKEFWEEVMKMMIKISIFIVAIFLLAILCYFCGSVTNLWIMFIIYRQQSVQQANRKRPIKLKYFRN